jgi:hypothetical protein
MTRPDMRCHAHHFEGDPPGLVAVHTASFLIEELGNATQLRSYAATRLFTTRLASQALKSRNRADRPPRYAVIKHSAHHRRSDYGNRLDG